MSLMNRIMGAKPVYRQEELYDGQGMLDPTWFDNVKRDPHFTEMALRDIPEHVPSTVQMLANNMVPGMFCAGGSCMTMFDKFHRFTDVDVWVNNDTAYTHTVGLLNLWGFKSSDPSNKPLQEWNDGFTTVQIIKADKLKDLEDLLSTFDFTCCKIGFDHKSIRFNAYTKTEIEHKNLTLGRLEWKDPGKVLFRILKYGMKGYKVTPTLIRDLWNANKEPLKAPNNLAPELEKLKDELLRMVKEQSAQDQQDLNKWFVTTPPQLGSGSGYGQLGQFKWTVGSSSQLSCGKCGSQYHTTDNHTGY